MSKKVDFNFNQRAPFIALPPLDAKESKIVKERLLRLKEESESVIQGRPSKINTKSRMSEKERTSAMRIFKKNGDTSLRKFVKIFQKELDYCSYEKFFYSMTKDEEVLRLVHGLGFLNLTESVLVENYWEKKVRRRYYINYENHQEFIEFAKKYIVARMRVRINYDF